MTNQIKTKRLKQRYMQGTCNFNHIQSRPFTKRHSFKNSNTLHDNIIELVSFQYVLPVQVLITVLADSEDDTAKPQKKHFNEIVSLGYLS